MLLDVTRLIWRASRGRLPTGIDRVCLAYVDRYRQQSRAVVQYRAVRRVLPWAQSQRLFEFLLSAPTRFGPEATRLAFGALSSWRTRVSGEFYLNIGHTGLDQPGLGEWLDRIEVRPIFLLHDLIPISHPEYCRAGERPRHVKRLETMLRAGEGILCNSRATYDAAADYASAHGVALPSAEVAWLGTTPLPVAQTHPQSDRPYFVMLGTIEGRKNHLLILQVWAEMIRDLGDRAPRLLIIGQRGWECEQVVAMLDRSGKLGDHVTELARCTDDELADYMRHATALLFPSFVEGYGMPLTEALAHGTPVIASDIAVFREIAGAVPDFLNPTDGLGWRRMIENYVDPDHPARNAQLQRMVLYHPPTWDAHFQVVDDWLERLG